MRKTEVPVGEYRPDTHQGKLLLAAPITLTRHAYFGAPGFISGLYHA
jgi:hypothetical protein